MDLLAATHTWLAGTLGALGSIVNLSGLGHYIHWHWIYISVANLIVIGLMLLAFVLAILVPFPRHRSKRGEDHV
jgi:hypothetical protein